jgi:hypothetical protein
MLKEKVVAIWGTKNLYIGYRYHHHMSNRLAYRVWYLYQQTYQRPIDRNDDISMKFAIVLLAEKEGHMIYWCTLEEKFCHCCGKAFESTSEYRLRLEWEGKTWPMNKVGPDTASETEDEDDWKVHVGGKEHGSGVT